MLVVYEFFWYRLSIHGGGGGGAGAAGQNGVLGGNGGAGVQVLIAGPTSTRIGALNPGPGEYQWFAGGGGGTSAAGFAQPQPAPSIMQGGVGGGGSGGPGSASSTDGQLNTGGGGGAASGGIGKEGGSGIVVVRYKIGSLVSTKATGGVVTSVGSKTVHVFTQSGTFTASEALTIDYLMVGGGGGAGNDNGSGAGGGGVVAATGAPISPGPYAVVLVLVVTDRQNLLPLVVQISVLEITQHSIHDRRCWW